MLEGELLNCVWPRVGVFGTNGGVSFASMGFDKALETVGLNTGNLLYQYAVWNDIKNPKCAFYLESDISFYKNNIDILVIPAANQINPAWDLKWWAKFIEKLDKPMIVVGLGVQAPIGKTHKLPLNPGTQRFLKLISERSKKIGVRGRYTQDVLNYHGVKNTEITGCPSNFINPNLTGSHIEKLIHNASDREKLEVSHVFGTLNEITRTVERILFNININNNGEIVYQTDSRILRYLHDRKYDDEIKDYFVWIKKVVAPSMPFEAYLEYICNKGKFYSDARTWIDEAGRKDIVFGMRIHGCIAAIQGGGLGVCITFDSRTLELAQTMGYPHVLASEIGDNENLSGLIDKIRFDPNNFDKTRQILYNKFSEIFKEANIKLSTDQKMCKGRVRQQ